MDTASVKSYRDLAVWQGACDLAERVYRCCRHYPSDELYGLTSQTRRAAVSIAANIAEGAGRKGSSEFAHFISIAAGSLAELRTLLELARRFGYLPGDAVTELDGQADEVARMLHGLRRSLERSCPSRTRLTEAGQ
jgi:four helix bundle protein